MITVLTGDNSFEIERALQTRVAAFDGVAEKLDGSTLELRQLPDLLMGGTLFAANRLVVVRNLAENKSLWTDFSDWLGRVSDDVQLVLVEAKLDKRTKTYKELKKVADLQDYTAWTERDSAKAEQWVALEAQAQGLVLDRKSVQLLVARVGADQWGLYHALQKLSVLEAVTPQVIEEVIELSPTESVFNLFEAALRGNGAQVQKMVTTLALNEDPYRLFGLLSGQAFQLAALSVADGNADVAKDVGAHPFALSKLAPYAKKYGHAGARKVIAAFAEADSGMKNSVGEPWLLIERALMKVAQLS
jgi:DNA polymerase III delta subunit